MAVVIAGDAVVSFVALVAAVFIRRSIPLAFTRSLLPPAKLPVDATTIVLFCGSFLFALAISGFYRRRVMPTERPLLPTMLLIQVAIMTIGSVAIERPLPRTILVAVVVIEPLLLTAWRRFLVRAFPVRPRETILVGDAHDVETALGALAAAADTRVQIIGWVGPAGTAAGVPWLGSQLDPAVRLRLRDVEEVIFTSAESAPAARLDLLRVRGPRGYVLLASPADALIATSTLGWLGDQPLVEIAVGCGYGIRAVVKRTIDLAVGAVIAILILPVIVVVAAAVAIADGRPILIRQVRVGRDGLPFRMWKFRSMEMPRDANGGANVVTGLGWFLRRYRIDELPQLLNVLMGEMSLVGPRPERPDLAAAIMRDVPDFDLRCLVKPGIAGLAQISAKYDTRPEVKLRYDLTYMCGWSLLLDLRLMFASVSASLAGSGR